MKFRMVRQIQGMVRVLQQNFKNKKLFILTKVKKNFYLKMNFSRLKNLKKLRKLRKVLSQKELTST
jgi:hypothetical protein